MTPDRRRFNTPEPKPKRLNLADKALAIALVIAGIAGAERIGRTVLNPDAQKPVSASCTLENDYFKSIIVLPDKYNPAIGTQLVWIQPQALQREPNLTIAMSDPSCIPTEISVLSTDSIVQDKIFGTPDIFKLPTITVPISSINPNSGYNVQMDWIRGQITRLTISENYNFQP